MSLRADTVKTKTQHNGGTFYAEVVMNAEPTHVQNWLITG